MHDGDTSQHERDEPAKIDKKEQNVTNTGVKLLICSPIGLDPEIGGTQDADTGRTTTT